MRNFLTILGVVVGAALAFFLYTMFFVEKPQALTVAELGDNFVGKAVVVELEKLQSLRIRDEIFSTPAYNALVDNSIRIQEEAIGRPNPFLPIGAGVATVILSDRVSTSTQDIAPEEFVVPASTTPATSTRSTGGSATTPRR